jgi:hypothetical protein
MAAGSGLGVVIEQDGLVITVMLRDTGVAVP